MKFPKSLTIFLHPDVIQNVTETGEVTATSSVDLDFIKMLTKGLSCSYQAYSVDLRYEKNGSFYIGDVPISEEYYEHATYPYASSDVTFATEKPQFSVKTFASLKPFTFSVWIVLLLCVILASLMHFIIFWRRISFMSAFFYIVGTLFGKHHNWKPKSLAQKLLILTWSSGIMFLTLSYGSVLLSFLTVPVRAKGITDLGDLYEAVRLKKAIAVTFEGSGEEITMAESEDTKIRFLGEHIKSQKKVEVDHAQQIIKPNVAVVATRNFLNTNFFLDKHFISQDSFGLSYYFMYDWTDEGFCCKHRVNEVIHWIWAAGFNKKLYDDLIFRDRLRFIFKNKDLMRDEGTIHALRIADMSGAFYFLVIGHILGLLCLLCEIFAHHYSYKV